jgi:hypothetical protein
MAIPQILINQKNAGVASPFLQGKFARYDSLMHFQLQEGLRWQKIEGNVDDEYADIYVRYIDEAGEKIIATEDLNESNFSMGKYIGIIFKYPIDYLTILATHFFNALDQKYPEIYIKRFYRDTTLISLINYTFIFVIILYFWYYPLFIKPKVKKQDWKGKLLFCKKLFLENVNCWLLLVMMAPIAVALPGAIETRFFLPVHIFIYAVVTFYISYDKLWIKIKNRPLLHLCWWLVFLLICFSFSSLILANLELEPILINENV